MDRWRQALPSLCQAVGVDPAAHSSPLHACDAMLCAWRAAPKDHRPDQGDVIHAVGVLLGDAVKERCGATWMVVTDPFGTSMSLVRASPQIILSPIDAVAKRIDADGPPDMVVRLESHLTKAVEGMMAAITSPPTAQPPAN